MNNYICYNRGGYIRLEDRQNKTNSLSLLSNELIEINVSRFLSETISNNKFTWKFFLSPFVNDCPSPSIDGLNREYLHTTEARTAVDYNPKTKVKVQFNELNANKLYFS